MMFHLKCNVDRWKSDTMRTLDRLLTTQSSTEMNLPWEILDLLEDGEHFTPTAQLTFETEFSRELMRRLPSNERRNLSVLVVGDSTIGHHDWHRDVWHGAASRRLAETVRHTLQCRRVEVDAVCGSGFIARSEYNEHFHARLAKWTRTGRSDPWDVIVLVGGWNDEGRDPRLLHAAVRGCIRTVYKNSTPWSPTRPPTNNATCTRPPISNRPCTRT